MGDLLDYYKTFFSGNSRDLMENKHPVYSQSSNYWGELTILGLYVWHKFDIGDRLGMGNCEEIGNCFDGKVGPFVWLLALDGLVRLGNKYFNEYDTSWKKYNSPGIIGTIKDTIYYGNRN